MTHWEYKIEKVIAECAPGGQMIGIQKPTDGLTVIETRLNDLGREGWELIGISGPPPWTCNPPIWSLYTFRRPRPVIGTPLPNQG